MNWLELFESSEYELPLEMTGGDQYRGGPGYPDATIRESELMIPTRTIVQRVELAATDSSGEREEKIRIYRVLAELENGELVELTRKAVASEAPDPVDTSVCAACLGKIPDGQAKIQDGKAYHRICIGGGDVVASSSGNRGGGVPAVDSGRSDNGSSTPGDAQTADAVAREVETPTVTKVLGDDVNTVSHLVSVTSIDKYRQAVTLWAMIHGTRSGTVVGRWPSGLFHGDIPSRHDVEYIDDKFFGSDRVVTASDLRAWNGLYKKALSELNPPR